MSWLLVILTAGATDLAVEVERPLILDRSLRVDISGAEPGDQVIVLVKPSGSADAMYFTYVAAESSSVEAFGTLDAARFGLVDGDTVRFSAWVFGSDRRAAAVPGMVHDAVDYRAGLVDGYGVCLVGGVVDYNVVMWQDPLGVVGEGDAIGPWGDSGGQGHGRLVIRDRFGVFRELEGLDYPGGLTGIDAVGEAIGFARDVDWETHAAAWSADGVISLLPELDPTSSSMVEAMNQSGVLVGWSEYFPDAPAPVRWDAGVLAQIESPDAIAGKAHGINDAGNIVGYRHLANGDEVATLWTTDGEVIDLGVLGNARHSTGLDINNRGEVVGDSEFTYWGGYGARRAFHWYDGVMTELPTFPDAEVNESTAIAINDRGEIVGWALLYENGSPIPAVWRNGEIHQVGSWIGQAADINDAGQISGFMTASLAGPSGFIATPR